MGMTNVGGGGHRSQINVTPLVDVVLVLLIIFMVVVPIARRAYELDVPVQSAPAEREPDETRRQIVLHIRAEDCPSAGGLPEVGLPPGCRVRLADAEIDVAGLAAATERIYAGSDGRDRVLFLAAEDDLEYELVLRIVDAARARVPGLRIGLVADPGPSSPVLISRAGTTGVAAGE